jgi:uncharacterized SAM-binding protein YcdF (DUF218 family)
MLDPYLIVLLIAAALLFVMSLPYCGAHFLRSLEPYPPLGPDLPPSAAGAIVIMGGDIRWYAPEFGGQTVGRLTLERLRYGATLHRLTNLPLLVTGGSQAKAERSTADMMRDLLEGEFNVPVLMIERGAGCTSENARFSADILSRRGIACIYLVSHAWHMRRAAAAFEAAGLICIAAPTHSTGRPTPILADFRPSVRAFQQCVWAAYEWAAILRDALRAPQKPQKASVKNPLDIAEPRASSRIATEPRTPARPTAVALETGEGEGLTAAKSS